MKGFSFRRKLIDAKLGQGVNITFSPVNNSAEPTIDFLIEAPDNAGIEKAVAFIAQHSKEMQSKTAERRNKVEEKAVRRLSPFQSWNSPIEPPKVAVAV